MNALMRRSPSNDAGSTGWFICVAFSLVGMYIVGLALDIIPNDPSQWHVPRWLGVVVGLVFILAGWVPVLSRVGAATRTARIVFALTIVGLGAVSNWALFHPQPTSAGSAHASRWSGAAVRINAPLADKYQRPLLLFAWDIPMAAFALWLAFGGRGTGKKD
jgi:hypothetical protein